MDQRDREHDRARRDRIAARDAGALRECYDLHAGAMLGLARRVLGDDHRAEEIVQEVLLRLWDDPGRYDPGRGALRTFLFREVHSRAIERLRSEGARRAREERHDAQDRRPTGAADVEQEALASIGRAQLRRALKRLGEGERAAIELAYFGGLSYREAAIELGEPEGTVKSRIRAGLAKLADLLDSTSTETFP